MIEESRFMLRKVKYNVLAEEEVWPLMLKILQQQQ